MEEGLLSVREAAELLGYSVQHTRHLARHGTVAATKIGRDWLIQRESVVAMLQRRATIPLIPRTRRGRPRRGTERG